MSWLSVSLNVTRHDDDDDQGMAIAQLIQVCLQSVVVRHERGFVENVVLLLCRCERVKGDITVVIKIANYAASQGLRSLKNRFSARR